MRFYLILAAVLSYALSSAALAQRSGNEGESYGGGEHGNLIRTNLSTQIITSASTTLPAGIPFNKLSKPATDAIVRELSASSGLCGRIAKEYMIDCISDRLARIAAGLPKTGEYREARAALERAAVRLHQLAQANAATNLPKVRVQAKGEGGKRPRRLTPVQPESFDRVKRQAEAIIAEAETVLLRSAENSQKRKTHYLQIARAVNSNKVILRSL